MSKATEVTPEIRAKQVDLLVQLRRKLTGKMHVQPFTIYNNEVIKDLVKAQPHTLEELSKVKGFPKEGKRIRGFGASVLDIFNRIDEIKEVVVEGDGDELSVKTEIIRSTAFGS